MSTPLTIQQGLIAELNMSFINEVQAALGLALAKSETANQELEVALSMLYQEVADAVTELGGPAK